MTSRYFSIPKCESNLRYKFKIESLSIDDPYLIVNNGMQIARQIDIDLGNEVTKPRGLQPLYVVYHLFCKKFYKFLFSLAGEDICQGLNNV